MMCLAWKEGLVVKQTKGEEMPVADQVKSLTEDIQVSHGTRAATISDIMKETHQTLEDFQRERAEKTRNLRHSLTDSRQELADRTRDLKHARVSTRSELTDLVQQIRAENNKNFQEQTHETDEFIAHSKEERREEFDALIDDIKSTVATIERETDETIANFNREHREMAKQLRNNLHETVSGMMADFSADRRQSLDHWANLVRSRRAPIAKPARKA